MTQTPKHTLTLECDSEEPAHRPLKVAKSEEGDLVVSEGEEDEEEPPKPVIGDQPMSQNPRIQRYLVAIEYIGTRFSGSQKQLTCRTVVGVLEVTTLSNLTAS